MMLTNSPAPQPARATSTSKTEILRLVTEYSYFKSESNSLQSNSLVLQDWLPSCASILRPCPVPIMNTGAVYMLKTCLTNHMELRGLTQFGIMWMTWGISTNLVRNLGITGISGNINRYIFRKFYYFTVFIS